jgi:S1-C subfamily serine protease
MFAFTPMPQAPSQLLQATVRDRQVRDQREVSNNLGEPGCVRLPGAKENLRMEKLAAAGGIALARNSADPMTNAALQPGDSGGPLLNGSGKVVGMDTAASTGSGFGFAAYNRSTDAYAIPINTAVTIAKQIVAGTGSATVHIGGTAFLGIDVSSLQSSPFAGGNGATSSGVMIAGVVSDGSAAAAGLTEGDVITTVDGTTVSTASGLQSIILAHKPGDEVDVAYTDATGQNQTATVTLGSGPPL